MLRELRLKRLHETIVQRGSITVEDGAQTLDVSVETLRRDLQQLANLGLVIRTRGGAAAPGVALTEVDLSLRAAEHHAEKVAMARLVVDRLLEEGSCVALDAGTTTLEIARAMRGKDLLVVTNSMAVANELSQAQCRVIVLGGALRGRSLSTVGPLAESAAREFHYDLALVSAPAISAEFGLMDTDLEAVAIKRSLLRNAVRKYAVLDYSKFERTAFTSVCGLDALTGLVTDAGTGPEVLAPYEAAGLEVLVAPRRGDDGGDSAEIEP